MAPESVGRVEALMRRMPKVELHVHLEGSMSAARLRAIAERDGLEVDAAAYATTMHERSFGAFLRAFMARLRALRTPDDWALVLDDLLATQAAENVAYTEAFATFTGALRGDYVLRDVLCALADVESDWRRRRCALRLVLDAPRELGPEACTDLVRLAAADETGLLVGIGIGGDETLRPAADYAPAYQLAKHVGLHRTAHAGERAGPSAVVAAVEVLGAERIGHGLSAAEDPAVLDLLVERGITVDVCPGSNRATGAWDPGRGPHPLRSLVDAGVRIDVGSDDPAIFGTNVSTEWASLVLECGLSPHRCLELTADAVRATFLDAAAQTRLAAQVEADLVDLRDEALQLEGKLAAPW